MVIDSNIIIYAAQPAHPELRKFIADHAPSVSVISYIEVVGFHRLTDEERKFFQVFFDAAAVLPISDEIVEWAVQLRQNRKISLGDALIAGTALAHDLTLVTRNTKDFVWISELKLLDPFTQTP
jgi:predicted nucleic acid-binding protein